MLPTLEYFEIRPCVDFGDHVISYLGTPDTDTGFCTANSAQEEAATHGRPVFWTLYAHLPLPEAVGDFDSFGAAYRMRCVATTRSRSTTSATSPPPKKGFEEWPRDTAVSCSGPNPSRKRSP